ncbi:hypothetical protein BV22DRAFT_1025883 [Leucogyrophana mollusca]|uniref:Uncharacterized protein n=1 Tax=Leucogyrophana mollusca TaxID=85980 RepID=A0ACB8AXF9_9AGAM|nr:hypothetical protein BV22DRAFT_1025883 [Leucogyrophana mollusca]
MMHDGVVMPHPPMLRALDQANAKLDFAPNIEEIHYVTYKDEEGYNIVRAMYFEDGGKTVRRLLEEGGADGTPLSEWVISPPHGGTTTPSMRDTFRRAQCCDVVLCPRFHGTASRHVTAKYRGNYTAIWNILDYPGIAFLHGLKADPSVASISDVGSPIGESDNYNHSHVRCMS